MVRLFLILRKLVIILAPMAIFYLLKKGEMKDIKKKSSLPYFDKSKIVEGEIIQ